MKKEFIVCASYATAKRHCPWAMVIAKADGGFWAFESAADYRIWKRQI